MKLKIRMGIASFLDSTSVILHILSLFYSLLYSMMPHIKNTLLPLNRLSKSQLKLYNSILNAYPDSIEITGGMKRPCETLKDLGLVDTFVTDNNHYHAQIPGIKFTIKFDSGKLNTVLDQVYSVEILIAPDFYTAFQHSSTKWKSLFLGVELYDIAAET